MRKKQHRNQFSFVVVVSIACALLLTGCVWQRIHEIPTYTITTIADPLNKGVTTGDGSYQMGTTVILTATPNDGYSFYRWNDGIKSASRKIVVFNKDQTFTASFI